MKNLFTIAKRRKTRLLHSGYRYEGKLLKNSIDSYFLNNKHVKYLIEKMDIALVGISNSIENLENFFNIAVDLVEDYNITKKRPPVVTTKTGYAVTITLVNVGTTIAADIRLIDNKSTSDRFIQLSNRIPSITIYISKKDYVVEAAFRGTFVADDVSFKFYEKSDREYTEGVGWITTESNDNLVRIRKSFPASARIPHLKLTTSIPEKIKYLYSNGTNITSLVDLKTNYSLSLTDVSDIEALFNVGTVSSTPRRLIISYGNDDVFVSDTIYVDTNTSERFWSDIVGWLLLDDYFSITYDSGLDKYSINDVIHKRTYIHIKCLADITTENDIVITTENDIVITTEI